MDDLLTFLRARRYSARDDDGGHGGHGGYSHLGMGAWAGCYRVVAADLPRLHALVAETVLAGHPVHLLEVPHGYGSPLRADLDFEGVEENALGDDTEEAFVRALAVSAGRALVIEESVVKAYVMRKAGVTSKPQAGRVKAGVHVILPALFCAPRVQEWVRRDVLASQPGCLEFPGCTVGPEDVYDDCVIRNGWPLYGCSKAGGAAYRVTRVLFIEFRGGAPTSIRPRVGEVPVCLGSVGHFSLRSLEGTTEPSVRPVVPASAPPPTDDPGLDPTPQATPASAAPAGPYDDAAVRRAVRGLSRHRADTESTWKRVGWALNNVSRGDPRALAHWKAFSALSDKFDAAECDKLWEKFAVYRARREAAGQPRCSMGSLMYWSRQDRADARLGGADAGGADATGPNDPAARALAQSYADGTVDPAEALAFREAVGPSDAGRALAAALRERGLSDTARAAVADMADPPPRDPPPRDPPGTDPPETHRPVSEERVHRLVARTHEAPTVRNCAALLEVTDYWAAANALRNLFGAAAPGTEAAVRELRAAAQQRSAAAGSPLEALLEAYRAGRASRAAILEFCDAAGGTARGSRELALARHPMAAVARRDLQAVAAGGLQGGGGPRVLDGVPDGVTDGVPDGVPEGARRLWARPTRAEAAALLAAAGDDYWTAANACFGAAPPDGAPGAWGVDEVATVLRDVAASRVQSLS